MQAVYIRCSWPAGDAGVRFGFVPVLEFQRNLFTQYQSSCLISLKLVLNSLPSSTTNIRIKSPYKTTQNSRSHNATTPNPRRHPQHNLSLSNLHRRHRPLRNLFDHPTASTRSDVARPRKLPVPALAGQCVDFRCGGEGSCD